MKKYRILGCLFDTDRLQKELEELEKKTMQEDFWNDSSKAQTILQKSKALKDKIEAFNNLEEKHEEIEILLDMAVEENDESLDKEIKLELKDLSENIEKLRIETLLSGEYDKNNAILSIHAGAGGLDAQDWAEMLLRMYLRWCDKRGFKVKTLDLIRDTEAGVKSVTLLIKGENAYGYLKGEKGVHRLVRISPFDSSGKRHTSFASIDIMPEIDENVNVNINPVDLKIDTYRAGGAGGQHVNTTDSAVRITHIPTGVVVQCQNERSQHMNRDVAMKMLMSKLIELKEAENKEKIEDIKGDYSQIAWGSQIRSYVFNPYNLVKDHRTNAEIGNVGSVMDGNIDLYINEYLKWKKGQK
nr:peptide chain release factor 2 [Anaeromicrobium sediminis]